MTEIERLLAIEEIKQVKAKYFYAFDHKDWEQYAIYDIPFDDAAKRDKE